MRRGPGCVYLTEHVKIRGWKLAGAIAGSHSGHRGAKIGVAHGRPRGSKFRVAHGRPRGSKFRVAHGHISTNGMICSAQSQRPRRRARPRAPSRSPATPACTCGDVSLSKRSGGGVRRRERIEHLSTEPNPCKSVTSGAPGAAGSRQLQSSVAVARARASPHPRAAPQAGLLGPNAPVSHRRDSATFQTATEHAYNAKACSAAAQVAKVLRAQARRAIMHVVAATKMGSSIAHALNSTRK